MKTNNLPLVLVYIIDDSEFEKELLIRVLKNVNPLVESISFDNCSLALHGLKNTQKLPDLIFLDLGMPGLSGKDCLKEIKQNARFNNIPVIIYSGSRFSIDEKQALELGANYFIPKSRIYDSLYDTVTLVLKRYTPVPDTQ